MVGDEIANRETRLTLSETALSAAPRPRFPRCSQSRLTLSETALSAADKADLADCLAEARLTLSETALSAATVL